MDEDAAWMSAAEAARALGVSPATLYAYVSRGRLRAHALPGRKRSRYRRSEVEQLARASAAVRAPQRVAGQALDWGLPVLESSLTLIHEGRLWYRGADAAQLAEQATLEEVALRLWQQPAAVEPATALPVPRRRGPPPRQPRELATALARVLAAHTPANATEALQAMTLAATGRPPRRPGEPVHEQLRRLWRLPPEAGDALRRALVLCADHELNASSFTVRCVAATGAGLGECLVAGLAALSGPRHGGITAHIEVAWPEVEAARLPRTPHPALAAAFRHPLYPDGDPRARALLARLPRDARRERYQAWMARRSAAAPAVDFALVALRRALGAPEGAAFVLFALGRCVGWIAHALEQQRNGSMIRPRAAYVGPPVSAAGLAPDAAPPSPPPRRRGR